MRHYEFMLGRTMKAMYCDFLVDTATSIPLKCQVRFYFSSINLCFSHSSSTPLF